MLFPSRWSLYPPSALHVRFLSTPRRGQNLTERYRRLENPVKFEHILELSRSSQTTTDGTRTPKLPDTIAGFVIPREPRPPADDECCMSGCAVCVYDLYEEALATYKDSVTTLRAALVARQIPETEWPAHIRMTKADASPTASKGAVLDAFEEMERALREKREKRTVVETEKKARGDVLVDERVGLDFRGVCEGIRWVIFPNR